METETRATNEEEVQEQAQEQEAQGQGARERWNVISAGPSRKDLEASDLLEDAPVVAINRALDVRDRLPVDIWAFWDHPVKVKDVAKGLVYPPLVVWLGADQFAAMTAAGFGRSKHPDWELDFDPRIGFRPLDKGLVWDPIKGGQRSAFTLVYVLERCARFGAKHIRLLSCDMAGPWHLDAKTEAASRAINRWDRWGYERAQLLGRENDDPEKSYPGLIRWFRDKRGIEVEIYQKPQKKKEAA